MSARAVFLSYASQDAGIARRLGEAMRAAGLEVWFDQSDLRGGDAWDETIRRQIADCALFVPLLSAATVSRLEGYFRLEWTLADQRTQRMARTKPFIVPLSIDATRETDADVPASFVRVQWSRLGQDGEVGAFVTRVKTLIEAAGAPPSVASPPGIDAAGTAAPLARRPARRALVLGVAIAVVLLAGLAVVAMRAPAPAPPAVPPPAAVAPAAPQPAASETVPDHSIAVLPFIDLSEKHDQEYFSDGLSEELLDLLAQIPDLRVAARTSSFYFKGRATDIAEIGRKLHVAHVLEGSLRKAGGKVRVTAQLIRTDSGYHVWSKTYDRDIRDIFRVQDEISTAVVEALKVQLLDAKPLYNRHQTDNTEAYVQYLLGKQLRVRDVPADLQQARLAFQRAIDLDPRYAAAYSALSDTEWRIADEGTNDPAGYARAAASAEKAIALAPDAPEGYWARGNLRFQYYYDWQGAKADLDKAHQLDPTYLPAAVDAADVSATLGRVPEALDLLRQVVAQDPLSPLAWRRLVGLLVDAQRLDEALGALSHLDAIADGANSRIYRGDVLLLQGRPADALRVYTANLANPWHKLGVALAQHALGHEPESTQMVERIIAEQGDALSYQIAEAYAWRGEKDAAFHWLERGLAVHDGGLVNLKHDVLLRSLRDDPRYAALLKTLGLPP